ncbi:SpoIIE family protein phosphatase [Nocardioides campestrisoli]|uniref:SpoIIE family protein phosphatase n=1 Tax=Nocardioides campestrisoli TaxID=2736757 RepID=UPI00163D93B3|nr:SpoIIE family protein phosphatase [Nocardioides campestrisoli]
MPSPVSPSRDAPRDRLPADRSSVLLVGPTRAERYALDDLPDLVVCAAEDLAAALADDAAPELVVLGSGVPAPLSLVPMVRDRHVGVTVLLLTTPMTEPDLRRDVAAQGRPDDLVLLGIDELRPSVFGRVSARAPRGRHPQVLATLPQTLTAGTSAATAVQPAPAVDFGPLLDRAPVGVVLSGSDGQLLGWNRKASVLLDLAHLVAGVEGRLCDVLPQAVPLLRALDAAGPEDEARELGLVAPTTAGRHLEVTAVRTEAVPDGMPGASGTAGAVLLLLVDVTEQRLAERGRERLSRQVDLLGRISESLTSTLEIEEALSRLAEVLVPEFADWVCIQLGDDMDDLSQVTVLHRNPALAGTAARMRARHRLFASEGAPSRRVASGGGPLLMNRLDEQDLYRSVADEELRELVRQMGVGSLLAVPLPGRDGILGSMVLVRDEARSEFRQSHLAVAVEAGRRAGSALDNARLYRSHHDLATELQRSLLTAPPRVAHGPIAVRYVAAAHEAQVGGDWYDAFSQPDGSTVLVVGDVIGHDRRAAAGMSQIRGVLRGIAYTTGEDPAQLLLRADRAMEGLAILSMATAVVVRLEPTVAPGIGERPSDLRLSWSCAGHPPPILLTPEGEVRLLGADDGELPTPDLLLGLDPQAPRTTSHALVPDGSTLLLYSDGLVERRGEDLDHSISRLADALALGPAAESLEQLCDRVLEQLLPVEPEDDVALVAVRLGSEL